MASTILRDHCPTCKTELPPGTHVHRCLSPAGSALAPRGPYVATFDGRMIATRSTHRTAEAELSSYVFSLLEDGLLQGTLFDYLPEVIPFAA